MQLFHIQIRSNLFSKKNKLNNSSEARPKAERSSELGWQKKKMNKKKRNHYNDYDDDDYDQFCTRSNILPFFSKFSHLCSFFSLQKVFMVSTTYQLFAKDILTKSFVRKKSFFEEKLENIFRKKNYYYFFFSKRCFLTLI